MSAKYPVVKAAGEGTAMRLRLMEKSANFSPQHLQPLRYAYFASACDCNMKLLSAILGHKGEDLAKVFEVAPLVGPSVVRDDVTVSVALVKASVAAVEEAGNRIPSEVLVGGKKTWNKNISSSSKYAFAVDDAISSIDEWPQYADDPERITCRQFEATGGYATLYVPRHPELGLPQSLLFYVNTDALQYPRSPAHALTTVDQIEAHFKAYATRATNDMKAFSARVAHYGERVAYKGGRVDAFAQQRAAVRWGTELPLLRNPQTLRSADRLVTEGALTAVVLAIAAGLEEAFAWSLPE